MRHKFLIILTFFIAISCKENSTSSENEPQNQANLFKVTVNAIVKKNDDFCLLYTEDNSLNFNDGIWKEVKGSENLQPVEFYFPNEVFPSQLRMDLGKNSEQEDITIKSIKFEYLGNVREIRGPEIGVFFRADDSKCTFDSATGTIKALSKDGKKSASLYPNETILAQELPKLAK
jgi:hypothetical protein